MQPMIFVDGSCVLCNGFAAWVLKRDKHRQLKIGTLQGNTALRLLPGPVIEDLDSVALLDEQGRHERSTAIIRIVMQLGGIYKTVSVLLIIPRFIRDAVYNFIAQHRYKWFGQYNSCRLPVPSERQQLLD